MERKGTKNNNDEFGERKLVKNTKSYSTRHIKNKQGTVNNPVQAFKKTKHLFNKM